MLVFGIDKSLLALPDVTYLPFKQGCFDRWFTLGYWRDHLISLTHDNFLEIIPYVMLTYEGAIFTYKRGQDAVEPDLRQRYSIGIGGHIEPKDNEWMKHPSDIFWNCLRREIREEIGLVVQKSDILPFAFIYDQSTAINSRHLAIVCQLEVENSLFPLLTETEEVTDQSWENIEDLTGPFWYDQLEPWSRIICDHL